MCGKNFFWHLLRSIFPPYKRKLNGNKKQRGKQLLASKSENGNLRNAWALSPTISCLSGEEAKVKNLQHFPEILHNNAKSRRNSSFGRHLCFSDFRQRTLKKSLSTRVTNQPIRQKSPLPSFIPEVTSSNSLKTPMVFLRTWYIIFFTVNTR